MERSHLRVCLEDALSSRLKCCDWFFRSVELVSSVCSLFSFEELDETLPHLRTGEIAVAL